MSTQPRTLGPNLRLHEIVITDRGCGSVDRMLALLAQSPAWIQFPAPHKTELGAQG